jgi:hypothetical protein
MMTPSRRYLTLDLWWADAHSLGGCKSRYVCQLGDPRDYSAMWIRGANAIFQCGQKRAFLAIGILGANSLSGPGP